MTPATTPSPADLGVGPGNELYRVVAEPLIVDQLALYGWAIELRRGDPARARSAAAEALDRWCRTGLPFRVDRGCRLFDVSEVINFASWASRHCGDPVWRRCMVDGYRRCVSELFAPARRGDGDGPLHSPTRVDVSLRREFDLAGLPAGKRLRLGLPLPCSDPAQVDVTVDPVESEDGAIVVSPGHLELRRSVPAGASPTAVIDVRISFTALHEGHDIDPLVTEPVYPEPTERWLQPGEGMIQLTPWLREQARAITGDGRRPGEILARIWRFVGENLRFGSLHFTDLDPEDPLQSLVRIGWADCYTASALLVALCRARGVPARMVRGALLYPVTPGGPHYWAEVLLPPYGWVPVDTLGWVLAGSDPDAGEWIDLFFGRLDYRMKFARLPDHRIGTLGVRYPRAWTLLQTPGDGGTLVTTLDVESGRFAFRDRWEVACGSITSAQGPARPEPGSAPPLR